MDVNVLSIIVMTALLGAYFIFLGYKPDMLRWKNAELRKIFVPLMKIGGLALIIFSIIRLIMNLS